MRWSGNHPETLHGIRVLDLTRLLPGPFGTILLADLGADVIKIEDPKGGDYARWFAPLVGSGKDAMGALFAAVNRGKRSVGLNLKAEAGKEIFRCLVDTADVVIESFRPGVMDRLGIGPHDLTALKPDLIYAAISGYGQDGPHRDRAGHDLDYIALSGALEQTGTPETGPIPPGFQLADLAGGGLYTALAVLAALYDRQRSGRGAHLDVSMTEGALTLMSPLIARLSAGDRLPETGRDMLTGGIPCYRVYTTADNRHMALAALEPKFWMAFCAAVGRPEWGSAGHTPDSPIKAEVEALFRTRSRDDWTEFFAAHDVCCEPVRSTVEALESDLLRARQVFFELGGPDSPQSLQTATPVTPRVGRKVFGRPPQLGEHTIEVLTEIGMTRDRIGQLIAQGVILARDG